MEKLTQIEKEAIASLIRQEINNGEKSINELEKVLKTKVDGEKFDKGIEIYMLVFKSHQIRKQRFEEIARKLEIKL